MFEVIPPISLETLETILQHLPEPSSIEIYLYGFDYSTLSCQVQKLISGLQLQQTSGTFRIENPSKQLLLEIYKSEIKNVKKRPRVYFRKAEWIEQNGSLTLTSTDLKANYSGKEPEYLQRIRTAVDGYVEIEISLR